MRQAVARAFSDTRPHRYAWFLDNDRMGEAFLRAALVLSDREADPGDIAEALILLRAVGFEDIARRAALQLLLDGPDMAAPGSDSDWISAFLEAQAAERGAARNTLLAYGRDLKDAMAWLVRRGPGFAGADRAEIEAYLTQLEAADMSPATRARRLSALKQLYRFAHEEGWRDDNPCLQIKGPSKARTLPDVLSVEEAGRLLDAARASGRNEGERLRNTCLIELLYATGLRVSELVSLPVAGAQGRSAHAAGARQGRQGTHGAAFAARAGGGADWLAHRDRAEDPPGRKTARRPRRICFRRGARPGT
jgi:integrase/recombinase XerD